jgi:hypothetical protein
MPSVRVLIVSEIISMRLGGEASMPFYYAKLFLQRGVDVWLGCHERVETELVAAFPKLKSQIRVVHDTRVQKNLWRFSNVLPYRIRDLLLDEVIHFSTQRRLRKIAIELARSGKSTLYSSQDRVAFADRGLGFAAGCELCSGSQTP